VYWIGAGVAAWAAGVDIDSAHNTMKMRPIRANTAWPTVYARYANPMTDVASTVAQQIEFLRGDVLHPERW
jgi:hypothetical protein